MTGDHFRLSKQEMRSENKETSLRSQHFTSHHSILSRNRAVVVSALGPGAATEKQNSQQIQELKSNL